MKLAEMAVTSSGSWATCSTFGEVSARAAVDDSYTGHFLREHGVEPAVKPARRRKRVAVAA